MRTPPAGWTEADAYLALDAALKDAWLTPERRHELTLGIVTLSLASPKAFLRLCEYGKQGKLVGELARRAYEASRNHPQGTELRAMLDRQPQFKVEPPRPVLLSRSQRAAWATLEETAQLYFSGELRDARIKPRTSRLIAGPSGIGKSHLVRTFAEAHGWGFLPLTFGEWIPQGSLKAESTASRVMKLLAAHERCVIAIDELDKIGGEMRQEWSVCVANDLYALLDRTWFQGPTGTGKSDIYQRLREGTFIVGCGTWQSLWAVEGGSRRSIGFQAATGTAAAMPDQIRAARVIATELLNRFNPELLLLEPMTAADFSEICGAEGLDAQAAELGQPLNYAAAEASGLGMRWIEAQVMRLHLARTRRNATNLAQSSRPLIPATTAPELS